ncbi:MAG: hypothetical protein SF069_15155 [Phycisphaerae bacterium]|nr:hypothetical protein [Phycisphaerae bacterium]
MIRYSKHTGGTKHWRRAPLAAIAAIWIWAMPASASSPGDLLRHAPDQATLAGYIPNLDFAVRSVAQIGRALKDAESEQLTTERFLGGFSVLIAADRVDTASGMVITRDADLGVGIVCRVLEPAGWAERVGAKELKPGLYSVERGGGTLQAAMRDGVLAIGELPDYADAVLQSQGQFGKRMADALGAIDDQTVVTAFVDVTSLRVLIAPWLFVIRQTSLAAMQAGGQLDDGTIAFWTELFDKSAQLVNESAGLAVALRAEPETLELRAALTPEAGSRLGAVLSSVKRGAGPLIRGLPDSEAAIIVANEWELSPEFEPLSMCFLRPLFDRPAIATAAGAEKHAAAMKSLIALYRRTTGYCFMAQFGGKSRKMIGVGVHYTPEPALTRDAVRALFESDPVLLHAFLTGLVGQIEAGRETVPEGEIDTYCYAIKHPDADAERAMKAMYGDRGAFCMTVRPEGTMFAMGPAAETPSELKRVLESKGVLAENPRVVAALKSLDADASGVALIDGVALANFVGELLRDMGLLAPRKQTLAERSDYMASAMFLEPTRVRFQVRLPRESLTTIVATVREMKERKAERRALR